MAARWWDRTGRHLIRNPEFRDPDIGFPSGITRGLEWEHLGRRERSQVVQMHHHHFVRERQEALPS